MMLLSNKQKRDFYENGYLCLPNAVSSTIVDSALRSINHSLGEEGMNKEELPTLRAQSYCREIRESSSITNLINQSQLIEVMDDLLGVDNLGPIKSGQIALRFPRQSSDKISPPHGHLDGLGSGLNGSDKGTYRRNFTALAVVLLNPLPSINSGNFTVWPKSHNFFADYFRKHGTEVLADGMPKVELPTAPVQLTGLPGDIILAHHQTVHTAAPNHSSYIRYAAIFRLHHRNSIGNDAYINLWHEWPGICQVAGHK